MSPDKEKIKQCFSKACEKYSENAVVQKNTAQKIAKYLKNGRFENILEIGAGTGFLTFALSQNIEFENYFANDLSEKSENFVKKFIPRAKFIEGDFEKSQFNEKFDLIASNAVFQWFENPEEIILKCYQMLNTGGILAFSTFLPDNFGEFKEITGLSLNYKSENEVTEIVTKYFKIEKTEKFKQTLSFNSGIDLLRHLKNTGVNSLSKKTWTLKQVQEF
jgi:malonyl-CoA O-methyltransferase